MKYKDLKYISLDECKLRKVYKLKSRNLSLGIFTDRKSFIGIREKFGSLYLSEEIHYDALGTAFPLEEIGESPKDIKLLCYFGTYDLLTGRDVRFDKPVSEGGIGWIFIENNEASKDIRPIIKKNDELFEFLKDFNLK